MKAFTQNPELQRGFHNSSARVFRRMPFQCKPLPIGRIDFADWRVEPSTPFLWCDSESVADLIVADVKLRIRTLC